MKELPRWRQCLVDGLKFFNGQLDREITDHTEEGGHPDRPTTARAYFKEVRGWDDETLDDNLLGWAPVDETALRDHLGQLGYSSDEMKKTGLFNEYGQPLWQGRYVFTYADENGDPAYAISRCTGKKGGGKAGYDGHPADFMSGKYAKLAHQKDWTEVDREPIYGLSTLRRDGPVIITEGIADAITAHEAGYACISPVTTNVKTKHREAFVDAIGEGRRTVVIQDAEAVTSSVVEREGADNKLTLGQFGPGVKGAVKTAHFLREGGVDAHLGELPLPAASLQKVDLDDYLQGWSDTLDPIIRSAKPAEAHPAFEPEPEEIDVERAEVSPSGEGSALWNLTVADVTGLQQGYRGISPLGHRSGSENYFIMMSDEVAYHHKWDVTYNGITYLLCEAGVRHQENPEGPLSDVEKFEAWRHAKEEGIIPSDDEAPYAALKGVAFKHDICTPDDITDGWQLPPGGYHMAVDIIEEQYELETGRRGKGEALALLPPVSDEWDWRQSEPEIPLSEARSRCQAAIEEAYVNRSTTIIDAIPSMGKSRGAINAAAGTHEPITMLVGRGHEEMYAQYEEWCDEEGLSSERLPSFTKDCPVANGDHGEAWQDRVMAAYGRGATGRDIHMMIEDMPCKDDGCEYRSEWKRINNTEPDVLIGHYTHAHVHTAIEGRTVVFDEFPGSAFERVLDENVGTIVSTYLQNSNIPVRDFTELLEKRNDPTLRDEVLREFVDREGNLHVTPEAAQAFIPGGHAAAPYIVLTLIFGEEDIDGWETAEIDGHQCLWQREEQEFYKLSPPDLLHANAVIGLDGTPTKVMWELALGQYFDHRKILDDDERSKYVSGTMNIELVRTTDYIKNPGRDGRYVNVEEDAALFENVKLEHDEKPALIAPQAALNRYEQAGVLEYINGTQYYGNLLGSNEFKHRRVGIVSGSMHYGDDFVQKWAAYADKDINREGKGLNLTYGEFGDKILTHMREHQTTQALFRFGRDGNGARVYVDTNTLEFDAHEEGRVVRAWSDGEKQVLETLNELGEAKTGEIADQVDVSERQVRTICNKLTERGYVTKTRKGRALVWRTDGDSPEHGVADLD